MKSISLLQLAAAVSLVAAGSLRRSSAVSSTNNNQAGRDASFAKPAIFFQQYSVSTEPLTVGLNGGPSSAAAASPPLIPQASSEVEAVSKKVHILAATGNLQAMKKLLKKEPYAVGARDAHGWTPLHEAARGAHIEMISLLLDHCAELNAMTYTGATPLYEAEKYNGKDSSVFGYLLSIGALRSEAKAKLRGNAVKFNTPEELTQHRVPHELAAKGYMDELNQLAAVKGSWVLDAVDANGWTPLHEAARYGHVHVARFLIDRGVSLNALSKENRTPVYYAKVFGGEESDIYKFLTSQGGHSHVPSSRSL